MFSRLFLQRRVQNSLTVSPGAWEGRQGLEGQLSRFLMGLGRSL